MIGLIGMRRSMGIDPAAIMGAWPLDSDFNNVVTLGTAIGSAMTYTDVGYTSPATPSGGYLTMGTSASRACNSRLSSQQTSSEWSMVGWASGYSNVNDSSNPYVPWLWTSGGTSFSTTPYSSFDLQTASSLRRLFDQSVTCAQFIGGAGVTTECHWAIVYDANKGRPRLRYFKNGSLHAESTSGNEPTTSIAIRSFGPAANNAASQGTVAKFRKMALIKQVISHDAIKALAAGAFFNANGNLS